MTEYIKMAVTAFVCGIACPLPISSSAHFSFVNTAFNFLSDERLIGFYYAVISLAFSAAIFISLRKIYAKVLKSSFSLKEKENSLAYKKVGKNILISLLPLLVLYIPVNEEKKLVVDYFDTFLTENGLLLTAFISVVSALFLCIAIWYIKKNKNPLKRGANTKTALRSAVYELVSYVIPGTSKVSLMSVNMIICDVSPVVIAREVYLYLAPQLFVISAVKIVRSIVMDLVINPILVAIAFVVVFTMSMIIINFVSKVNVKKLLGFFAVYSVVFGIAVGILSFFI